MTSEELQQQREEIIIPIIVEQLSNHDLVSLTYEKEDQIHTTFFTAKGIKGKFYNKKTKQFKIINYFEDTECTISASGILQIGVPSSEEYNQDFYDRAAKEKEQYQTVVETYKDVVDLTTIYVMSKEEAYATMYGILISELKSAEKCKSVVMSYIHKAVDLEIEKLTEEFEQMVDSTPGEASSDELATVIDFLEQVKLDYSIFDEANNYEKILGCWPVIIKPSPFYPFLYYVNCHGNNHGNNHETPIVNEQEIING